jgi:uncharacterized RDD family membrane protein YckC
METQFPPKFDRTASLKRRFFNSLLDDIVFQLVMFFILNPLLRSFYADPAKTNFGVSLLFSFLVNFFFYFGFETIFQRTPGKMITRTRVTMEDGSKPGAGTIALRTLIRFVPYDAISIYTGQEKRKVNTLWHDRWTGTRVVIQVDPAKEPANSEVPQFPPSYAPSSKNEARRSRMILGIVALGFITFTTGSALLFTLINAIRLQVKWSGDFGDYILPILIFVVVSSLGIFGIITLARNLKKYK